MKMHFNDDELLLALDEEHPAPHLVTGHLSECAECRSRFERYQALRAGLRQLPQAMAPNRDLFPDLQVARMPDRSVGRWAGRAAIAAAIYGIGVLTGAYARTEAPVADAPATIEARVLDVQRNGGAFASGLVELAANPALDDRQRNAIRDVALGTILTATAELRAMTPADPSLTLVAQNVAIARGTVGPAVGNLNRVTF